MAAKPEKDAPAAPATPAPAAAPASAGPSKIAALLPVILVVVLAPAVSWAVAQYVLLPQFEKRIAAAVAAPAVPGHAAEAAVEEAPAPAAESGGHGSSGKKGEAPGAANTYEFPNVVVNLAGSMGTRYLKTTFLVTGKGKDVRKTFTDEKPKLLDVTLNVLSALTLADLEEAGAKNIIREKLVQAYNQAMGRKIADQIYFSDFVVQ
jgi:flagellar FliL protein